MTLPWTHNTHDKTKFDPNAFQVAAFDYSIYYLLRVRRVEISSTTVLQGGRLKTPFLPCLFQSPWLFWCQICCYVSMNGTCSPSPKTCIATIDRRQDSA